MSKITSFSTYNFIFIFSFFSAHSQDTKIYFNNIPSEIREQISHDVSSHETFTSLTKKEKQLFLHSLLHLFTESSLQVMERLIRTEHILYLQEKKIKEENLKKIINSGKILEKIHLLQNQVYTTKKNCFSYIKQNSSSVSIALDHVKRAGSTLTTLLTESIESSIAQYYESLTKTVESTIHDLTLYNTQHRTQQDTIDETVPLCILRLDILLQFCSSLESSCQTLQKEILLNFFIVKQLIEAGLQMLNAYYQAIYSQLATEHDYEFLDMIFFSPQEYKKNRHLPADLLGYYEELSQQVYLSKKN